MLQLQNPEQTTFQIISFLKDVFTTQAKSHAVIAISGGLDSATSLSLLSRALKPEQIHCIMLPYGDQSTVDSETICAWNEIPRDNWHEIDIHPIVNSVMQQLSLAATETYRIGNVMARSRMIAVYDFAKKLDGLVVGTENKSEKHLGYFTMFGDAASDIEPIAHLYKTQIKQLAEYLQMPEQFMQKSPSAGLWAGQTDEVELGFTYAIADLVLEELVDNKIPGNQIVINGVDPYLVQKVVERVMSQKFKHEVPYSI